MRRPSCVRRTATGSPRRCATTRANGFARQAGWVPAAGNARRAKASGGTMTRAPRCFAAGRDAGRPRSPGSGATRRGRRSVGAGCAGSPRRTGRPRQRLLLQRAQCSGAIGGGWIALDRHGLVLSRVGACARSIRPAAQRGDPAYRPLPRVPLVQRADRGLGHAGWRKLSAPGRRRQRVAPDGRRDRFGLHALDPGVRGRHVRGDVAGSARHGALHLHHQCRQRARRRRAERRPHHGRRHGRRSLGGARARREGERPRLDGPGRHARLRRDALSLLRHAPVGGAPGRRPGSALRAPHPSRRPFPGRQGTTVRGSMRTIQSPEIMSFT